MRRLGPLLLVLVLTWVAMETLACGNSRRELTSITLSPAGADAQSYPNGQVPFAATGHYSKAPTTAALQPALWVLLFNGQQAVTINARGVAQCSTGTVGSFSIVAYAPADPSIPLTPQGLGTAKKAVMGMAQITCP